MYLILQLFEAKTDSSADILEGDFIVDFSVGRNLKLRVVNLAKKENIISIQLTGPNDQKSDQFEFEGTTASIQIAEAEVIILMHNKMNEKSFFLFFKKGR